MNVTRPSWRSEAPARRHRPGLHAFSSRAAYPASVSDLFSSDISYLQIAVWTGSNGCAGLPGWRGIKARRDAAVAWMPGPPLRSDMAGSSPHVGLIIDRASLTEITGEQSEAFLARLADEGGSRVAPIAGTVTGAALELERALAADSGNRLLREAKALELLAHVIVVDAGSPARLLTATERERLHHARDLLLDNLAEPPTIAALARACGLNTMKLKRDFKRMFGAPIYAYHRRVRLRHAREMIETAQISVTEAAYEIGYSSLGHFSAAFRQEFGLLPSEIARGGMSVRR